MIIIFPNQPAALRATPFFVEEAGLGCWVQSEDDALLIQGERRLSYRYALHIPSQTRGHAPLLPEQIAAFEAAAYSIGLNDISQATGFWTLENGVLQEEPLRIAWSEEQVDAEALRALARRVLLESDQEAVAIEVAGRVEVVRD